MNRFASMCCLLACLLVGCQSPGTSDTAHAAPSAGPYALVLGTAQDAGLPQLGCTAACCESARRDPERRRLVASLLVVDPESGGRWLFDATPDLREQVERARGHPPGRSPPGNRPPLFEAIYLTHAHMGHFAGLLQLGQEAYAARGQPVLGTARMVDFLERDEPWALAVRSGHLAPRVLVPDRREPLLGPDGEPTALSVTAFLVPHRDEVTDTVGYLIEGPTRRLAYLPDIDKWERWERPLEDLLADVDIALVDGSFYADGEIPGRSLADIPHPFISETLTRLADQPASLRARVVFTHLNHSNPAATPDSPAAQAIQATGMSIAQEGQRFNL